jgi:ABC-type multidrug transport system fused ATPase/permease subunit
LREFIRTLLPMLDRRTKRRLTAAGGLSLLLAILEAIGLALVAPLILVLNSAAAHQPLPDSVHWLVSLTGGGHLSAGRVAAILGALIFFALLAKGVLAVVTLNWSIGVVLQSETRTAGELLRAYLQAPYSFHLARNSAELQRTVHDSVRRIFEDAVTALVGAQADALVIVAVTIMLFVLQPVVAAVAVVYFALVSFVYQRTIHGRVETAGAAVHDDWRRAFQTVQQSVRAAKELAILHRQQRFVDELVDIKARMAGRLRTLILLFQLPRYYLELALIVGFGVIGSLLFATRPVDSAVAALGLFLVVGLRLLPSLNRTLVAVSATRSSLPALRQVASDLITLQPSEATGHEDIVSSPVVLDRLELERVTYSYPESRGGPVLTDVSLSIAAGETVAFVGASGAGKTTLVDIILGLLPPTSGDIRLNGQPLHGLVDAWQRSVGFVPQDVTLMDDTLLLNIALGEDPSHVDHEGVARAVRMAQLGDLVAELPAGLATEVGEDGVRLSGGQRQRVGIARALYHDPSVLVLDEATSSLDSQTEARITDTLDALRSRLTILIVAHRLSTVRRADRLFLLNRGRLAATGTFDDLLRDSVEFAGLVALADVTTGAIG